MKIVISLAGIFSFLGIADMPIGYYTFLRIYLTGVAGYLTFYEYSKKEKVNGWVISFGVVTILFNPIIPIFLHDKELWIAIDFIVGILFLIAGFNYRTDD